MSDDGRLLRCRITSETAECILRDQFEDPFALPAPLDGQEDRDDHPKKVIFTVPLLEIIHHRCFAVGAEMVVIGKMPGVPTDVRIRPEDLQTHYWKPLTVLRVTHMDRVANMTSAEFTNIEPSINHCLYRMICHHATIYVHSLTQ